MSRCETDLPAGSAGSIVNIAAYKFVALDDLEHRRQRLREITAQLNLRGTILLSPEGVNLFLAADRAGIDAFVAHLRAQPEFADLEVKESLNDYQPFNRMLIKIKEEIIAFGIESVDPLKKSSPKMPAQQLHKWLKEGRPVHLLDTRNEYEIEVGTFAKAINPGIDNFRDFPSAVERLPESMKQEPVVMFCTGGIRCEKAGPFMEQAGFEQVYQLEGGILKYFEECGGDFYDGDCFVFDQRVAVDPQLQETAHTQCYVCQEVVTPEEQESSQYVAGVSCPRCYREPVEMIAERVARKNGLLQDVVNPLPGSEPYFNKRPLNVPARFDGQTLLGFLAAWHPQVSAAEWQRKIESSEVVPGARYGRRKRKRKSAEESLPLSVDRVVRGGERFEHLQPGTTEPDVNGAVEIVHDDDQFVVVNKPAPLPLHPSGRFNRNTLQYMLEQIYFPEHPLLVHRLDANTSGVLVLCRKKKVARVVQPQFEQRVVSKVYLARVQGTVSEETFTCEARIAKAAGENGLRLIDESGQEAVTEFEAIRSFADGTTLLRVVPRTGRTNQIRLHLWHLGLPIVGDPAYLPDGQTGSNCTLSTDERPMCLHALEIALHDLDGERRVFQVAEPDWAKSDETMD